MVSSTKIGTATQRLHFLWLWNFNVTISSIYEHYSEKAVAGLLYALINHVYWVRLGQIDDYGDGYCFLEGKGIKTLLTVILIYLLHNSFSILHVIVRRRRSLQSDAVWEQDGDPAQGRAEGVGMEQEGHLAAGGSASNEGYVKDRKDFIIMDKGPNY